jgi:glucose-1-phosphate cytidylyltransferase
MNAEFLNFIKNSQTFLEKEPLERATKQKQLAAFKHRGFWQCMDTKRDKGKLDEILKKNII